jgi:hypothetical protein
MESFPTIKIVSFTGFFNSIFVGDFNSKTAGLDVYAGLYGREGTHTVRKRDS